MGNSLTLANESSEDTEDDEEDDNRKRCLVDEIDGVDEAAEDNSSSDEVDETLPINIIELASALLPTDNGN